MAPSAESSSTMNEERPYSLPQTLRKNVTQAINYEPSMVDQFAPSSKATITQTQGHVKNVLGSTHGGSRSTNRSFDRLLSQNKSSSRRGGNLIDASKEPAISKSVHKFHSATSTTSSEMDRRNKASAPAPAPATEELLDAGQHLAQSSDLALRPPAPNGKQQHQKADRLEDATLPIRSDRSTNQPPPTTRRSSRELKRRAAHLVSNRVRYDMELVPYANVNRAFLLQKQEFVANQRLSFSFRHELGNTTHSWCGSDGCDGIIDKRHVAVDSGDEQIGVDSKNRREAQAFIGDDTVIWTPMKRGEWNDSVSEMTAVCTSAMLRKFKGDKPFIAPLSRAYIRDRVDIDDPIRGYQMRHSSGGWLQGFVMWTNFTTWTHFFRWDSLHPASGIPEMLRQHRRRDQCEPLLLDHDGTLARKLNEQPRSGNPSDKGIVFDTVAEIGLLGGLGCGRLLLQMALASIWKHGTYKYVVLQATAGSKTFYESFGFRRVGAVCRYGKWDKNVEILPTLKSAVQGYCHWTHAHESQKSLNLHGGPSYMMCLDLVSYFEELQQSPASMRPSKWLELVLEKSVKEKPTIASFGLGSGGNLTPKWKQKSRHAVSVRTSSSPGSHTGTNCSSIATTPTRRSSSKSSQLLSPTLLLMEPSQSTRPRRPKRSQRGGVGNKNNSNNGGGDGDGECVEGDLRVRHPRKKRQRKGGFGIDAMSILSPPPHVSPPRNMAGVPVTPTDTPILAAATNQSDASDTSPHLHAAVKTRLSTKPAKTTPTSSSMNGETRRQSQQALQEKDEKSRTSCTMANNQPENTNGCSFESKTPRPIDKKRLMKQKVKSYPRNRIHYYNKVVRRRTSSSTSTVRRTTDDGRYFFVLNYDETQGTIHVVPMEARGKLSGKRAGRPRYQCIIKETDENFVSFRASDFEAVAAFMVMKTPLVAQEAWDVLEDEEVE